MFGREKRAQRAKRPSPPTQVLDDSEVSMGRPRASAKSTRDHRAAPRSVRSLQQSHVSIELDDGDHVLPIGTVIGKRYVIEQHISSGGFGAVYRASDREIRHHHVALKLLHNPCVSEDDQRNALRELKLLATVTHPSIVQFKEYGWHHRRLWFAMPWYSGQTLDHHIPPSSAGRGMSREEACGLFTRLAHGLAAMHAKGVNHHDIKPENIFVAQIAGFSGGLPVLLDLGIATQRGEHPIGLTVDYASPETAAAMLGDATVSIGSAADVFSLALVLRNALDPSLCESAVDHDDAFHILRERASVPAALSRRADLKYLAPHFRRWLSLNPNERPTAAELASELAVLTEPEEKRRIRLRMLRRALPVLMGMMFVIALLLLQLREKETALFVQNEELSRKKHLLALNREAEDALRQTARAQREELAQNAKTLAAERRLRNETEASAKKLNSQLDDAEARFHELDERYGKLDDAHEALVEEHKRLTSEQAAWSEAQQKLIRERDQLLREKGELVAQHEHLLADQKQTQRERETLTVERDQAREQASDLKTKVTELSRERDGLEAELKTQARKTQAAERVRAKVAEAKEAKAARVQRIKAAQAAKSGAAARPKTRKKKQDDSTP